MEYVQFIKKTVSSRLLKNINLTFCVLRKQKHSKISRQSICLIMSSTGTLQRKKVILVQQFLLKKNRKGFLLAEETLKIILAVISIGFLVYFLSALYFANQNSEELEQAEASLEFLINEINSGSDKVEIYKDSIRHGSRSDSFCCYKILSCKLYKQERFKECAYFGE